MNKLMWDQLYFSRLFPSCIQLIEDVQHVHDQIFNFVCIYLVLINDEWDIFFISRASFQCYFSAIL